MNDDDVQYLKQIANELSERFDSQIAIFVINERTNIASAVCYGCPACVVAGLHAYVQAHKTDKHTNEHKNSETVQ